MGQGGSAKNSNKSRIPERQTPPRRRNARHKVRDAYTTHDPSERSQPASSFSASRTLQLAQALYERHKAITYPRTDSKALPEDYGPLQRNSRNHLRELSSMPSLSFSQTVTKTSAYSTTSKSATTSPLFPEYSSGRTRCKRAQNLQPYSQAVHIGFLSSGQWDVTVSHEHNRGHAFKPKEEFGRAFLVVYLRKGQSARG